MFSTADSAKARFIRVYLETDKGEVPVPAPNWLGLRKKRARSFPAGFRVQKMAEDLAASTWVYSAGSPPKNAKGRVTTEILGGEASIRDRLYPGLESLRAGQEIGTRVGVRVNAVRVEIWRKRLDSDTNQLRLDLMTQATSKVAKP